MDAGLDRRLSVAPMMGYTDRHYRQLLRLISPNALLYSEMVVAGALLHGDAGLLLAHGRDAPCALQLGGSEPAELAQCAVMAEDAGYQEVNLNVGCPSERVQSGAIGACLMADPPLVADCIAAMQDKVQVPVTVKTRIGISERFVAEDDYDFFRGFIETVYRAGCRIFIIHARKAVLSGLSPRENRDVPPLRYEFVYRVRNEFPDAIFILNGGLQAADAIVDELTRVDGVMLGRVACANPWILAELEQRIFANPMPDRLSILAEYRDYIDDEMRNGQDFKHMARHLLGFFAGCPGARAFRRHLTAAMAKPGAHAGLVDQAVLAAGLGAAIKPTGTG